MPPFLNNKNYDALKWVAQILLPALATFYIATAPLLGLPKQEEVAGTIIALDLLLGTLLGISSQQYKNSEERFDGYIVQEENEVGGTRMNLILKDIEDPADVVHKKELRFRVKKDSS